MVHPDSAQLGAQPKHEDDILNMILDFLLETAMRCKQQQHTFLISYNFWTIIMLLAILQGALVL